LTLFSTTSTELSPTFPGSGPDFPNPVIRYEYFY
jgi:hypothetical protein